MYMYAIHRTKTDYFCWLLFVSIDVAVIPHCCAIYAVQNKKADVHVSVCQTVGL